MTERKKHRSSNNMDNARGRAKLSDLIFISIRFLSVFMLPHDSFSEPQKEQIRQGYGAVYRDLGTGTDMCAFGRKVLIVQLKYII